jgi:hypothetical protein
MTGTLLRSATRIGRGQRVMGADRIMRERSSVTLIQIKRPMVRIRDEA